MQKLWLKIISCKSNPLYWPGIAILWVMSLFYRLGWNVRYHLTPPSVRTKAPVISVGNMTVGGTGKTPMVIELARYFLSIGKKVGVVSSGYGRRNERDIVGTGDELRSKSVYDLGDEVMVMASELPKVYFGVSKSKSEAARMLDKSYSLDLIIVDDGYQHRRLYRNFNILLAEAGMDLRNQALFPLGKMREPLGSIIRADAVIVTKANIVSARDDFLQWVEEQYPGKIIATVDYYNENIISADKQVPIGDLAGHKIYFFAGIGSFEPLLGHLRNRLEAEIDYRQFSDHCCYPPSDAAGIKDDIDRLNPDYVITTYKDYVKLRSFDFGQPLYYLDLRLDIITGREALLKALVKAVEE